MDALIDLSDVSKRYDNAMARAAYTSLPASIQAVYRPAELVLLALSALVIGVVGALLPASWAARSRTAAALRAE